jgi:sugar phosphate isomerase/epimerase
MLGPRDLVFCAPPVAQVPLLDRLAPVRAAGFTGLSILPDDVWTLEESGMPAAEIAQRIADEGLQVAEIDCIGCWLPTQAAASGGDYGDLLRNLSPERVIGTAARIGARSVVVVEMFGVTPSLDEAARAFARVCDQAAEHGLLVHIEFLPFGGIPDLQSAWRIVEAAGRPNGGLTVDSWHLFRSGSTLEQLRAIPGDRVMSVQINDAPATPAADLMHETMTGRLFPGQGDFDLVGLIQTLDEIGCTAPLGVEVFNAEVSNGALADVAMKLAETTRARVRAAGREE